MVDPVNHVGIFGGDPNFTYSISKTMEDKKPVGFQRAIQDCGEIFERVAKEVHDKHLANSDQEKEV